MSEVTPHAREGFIEAVGAWGEMLEPKVLEAVAASGCLDELPFGDTDSVVRQVMVEFLTLAGALVIAAAEQTPASMPGPGRPTALSKSLIAALAGQADAFADGAARSIADTEKYYRNLLASPEVGAQARKYGLTPQDLARSAASDFSAAMTQAVHSIAPLVLTVAQEPWSTAALDERLGKVTGAAPQEVTAAPTGSTTPPALPNVGESQPAPPAAAKPDWYPDPAGRHQFRYWDGSRWTDHVADNGASAVDPLSGPAATAR